MNILTPAMILIALTNISMILSYIMLRNKIEKLEEKIKRLASR